MRTLMALLETRLWQRAATRLPAGILIGTHVAGPRACPPTAMLGIMTASDPAPPMPMSTSVLVSVAAVNTLPNVMHARADVAEVDATSCAQEPLVWGVALAVTVIAPESEMNGRASPAQKIGAAAVRGVFPISSSDRLATLTLM
jgi:hypothetical protein